MTSQNLPILIDQDGVVADFVGGLYHHLKQFLQPEEFAALPNGQTLKTFYIEDCVDTGDRALDAKLKSLINEAVNDVPDLFLSLPAMPGARQHLKLLQERAAEQGIDVLLCTAPHVENKNCHSNKAWWATRYLGPSWAKHMIMTHDKTLVQGLVLVDDKPAVTGRLQPTWQHIVFDAAYNQESPGPRVFGWSEQSVQVILDTALKAQLINGLR